MTEKHEAPANIGELAERAQTMSRGANERVAAAMRDVISSHAGLREFSVESVRDLVHFMVRRGQMPVAEGEQLIREAEAAKPKAVAFAPEKVRPMPKASAHTAAKGPRKAASKSDPKPTSSGSAGPSKKKGSPSRKS